MMNRMKSWIVCSLGKRTCTNTRRNTSTHEGFMLSLCLSSTNASEIINTAMLHQSGRRLVAGFQELCE